VIDTRTEVSNQFIASGSDGLIYVVLESTEHRNIATDKDAPENWGLALRALLCTMTPL
jgi:hypothetical protein